MIKKVNVSGCKYPQKAMAVAAGILNDAGIDYWDYTPGATTLHTKAVIPGNIAEIIQLSTEGRVRFEKVADFIIVPGGGPCG